MTFEHIQGLFSLFRIGKTSTDMVIGGPLALERTEKLFRQSIAQASDVYRRRSIHPAQQREKRTRETSSESKGSKAKPSAKDPDTSRYMENKKRSKHALASYMMKSAALLARSKRRKTSTSKTSKNEDSPNLSVTGSSREASLEIDLEKRRENWMQNGYNNYTAVPGIHRTPSTAIRKTSTIASTRLSPGTLGDSNPQFARLGKHLSQRQSGEGRYKPSTSNANSVPRTMPTEAKKQLQLSQMDPLQEDAQEWVTAAAHEAAADRREAQLAKDELVTADEEERTSERTVLHPPQGQSLRRTTSHRAPATDRSIESLTNCATELARSSSLGRQQRGARKPNGRLNAPVTVVMV